MIGSRLFLAFGWLLAITPAVRLNPSRVSWMWRIKHLQPLLAFMPKASKMKIQRKLWGRFALTQISLVTSTEVLIHVEILYELHATAATKLVTISRMILKSQSSDKTLL
jgi:hypothetical protein